MASLVLATLLMLASGADAQTASVSGRVLDAATARPVEGALVTLEARSGALLPDGAGRMAGALTVVTDESGVYRFIDLPGSAYRLRIVRIGYRTASMDIELTGNAAGAISVALELEPVSLEAVQAQQRSSTWFQRAANVRDEPDIARISGERQRQEEYLSSDTRTLTYADMLDGVTLGEGDVLRALQRFAGVSTRDDYTAELWTRGAPWTQTRVTYDGVPLFNPVHAIGILSAFNPETLGAAVLHPGARPAALGEGAAAVVELHTRPGGGSGAVRAVVDASPASSKVVLDQRVSEKAAWLVAARRSHLGVLREGLDMFGMDTLDLPFMFYDIAARGDLQLGRARIEASALHEQDRLTGDVAGVLERTRAHWGNSAGRATLSTQHGDITAAQTFGASRFRALIDEREITTREPADAWTEPETSNVIDFMNAAGRIDAGSGSGRRWSAGYEVARHAVSYDGPLPRHHAVRPDTLVRLMYERELVIAALWAEKRMRAGERLVVDPGVRVETSRALRDAPAIRLSPRIALRMEIARGHSISVSGARIWQHTQSFGLAGPSIHPAFHASHFWIWADARRPAIRADVVNVGTERWLGDHWLTSVNAWARFSDGVAAIEPRPGRLGSRPLFITAQSEARGLEAGIRRIGARWSVSAAYTLSRSDLVIRDTVYPAPADRRHVLDAMAAARVWRGVRLAAAYSSMSGAPFTRAYSRSAQDCTAFGFGCDDASGSYVERYNAERTAPHRSLDVSATWTTMVRSAQLTAYAQVRNVLARENASTYAGSVPVARVATPDGPMIVFDDRFESGLRRVPMIGLRLAFR